MPTPLYIALSRCANGSLDIRLEQLSTTQDLTWQHVVG